MSADGWCPTCWRWPPGPLSGPLPDKLRDHPWAPDVETVRGDVTDAASVAAAMRDVDVAYYLVHALAGGGDFEDTDRRAARTFAGQAHAAGVRRIVYLGGLTPYGVPEETLSPHLRSRAEWGGSSWTRRCPRPCCGPPS